MVPLLRQRGRRREIHRVFDGDLVAQAHAIRGERQPLDRVLARARRHVQSDAGRVGLEGDRIDHERLALPPADGVPVERGLNVGRMRRVHVDGAHDMVARVIEPHHDLVFADLDRAQLVEDREDRRGLDRAEPIGDELRLSGTAFRRDRPARHGPESRAERSAGGRPMTLEALGRREDAGSAIRGIERMNLAVLRRDVLDADLLAPTAAIGIGAHDDRRAGLQCVAIEAVDERLRDPEAFAFDQRRLAVRALGLDDQVHVRVHPVEPRDLPSIGSPGTCRTWTCCGGRQRGRPRARSRRGSGWRLSDVSYGDLGAETNTDDREIAGDGPHLGQHFGGGP